MPVDRLVKAVMLLVMGHQIGSKGTFCAETIVVNQALKGNAFPIASNGFRCLVVSIVTFPDSVAKPADIQTLVFHSEG